MEIAVMSLDRAHRCASRADVVISLVEQGHEIDAGDAYHLVVPTPPDPSIARAHQARQITDFLDDLRGQIADDALVLVHCKHGSRRSAAAAVGILHAWNRAQAASDDLCRAVQEIMPGSKPAQMDFGFLDDFDDVLGLSGQLRSVAHGHFVH